MNIKLRPINLNDFELLYSWQQHENTRRYFFHPQPPTRDKHNEWLKRSIENDKRYLLMGEIDNQPIGVLRYDVVENEVEVSIYIDPENHGQGIGVRLLELGNQWIKNNLQEAVSIRASITAMNIQSKKCFEKAGFSEFSVIYHYEL